MDYEGQNDGGNDIDEHEQVLKIIVALKEYCVM